MNARTLVYRLAVVALVGFALAASPGTLAAASPAPGGYAQDIVLVRFASEPNAAELESFEQRFLLARAGEQEDAWWRVRIRDNADAAWKQDWVAEDAHVCAVALLRQGRPFAAEAGRGCSDPAISTVWIGVLGGTLLALLTGGLVLIRLQSRGRPILRPIRRLPSRGR